ncbi:MAG: Lrp/AsnC family transcriptional regulator [Oleiphilaceae bacterium]|nr:Lrp/AsnC family transcriptional regulator [Oleiphilaceae bacterium]
MDDKNQQLLQRLRLNAREPVSSLARALNLSRSAVHERLRRLQQQGVIKAFTVKLDASYESRLIAAQVMIQLAPQMTASVVRALEKLPQLRALYSVSGTFDLLAVIKAETTEKVDEVLDTIGRLEGVEKTQSSIVLSTKFER